MIYSSKLLKDKDKKKKNLLDFNRYSSDRCQKSSQQPFISVTSQSNLNTKHAIYHVGGKQVCMKRNRYTCQDMAHY